MSSAGVRARVAAAAALSGSMAVRRCCHGSHVAAATAATAAMTTSRRGVHGASGSGGGSSSGSGSNTGNAKQHIVIDMPAPPRPLHYVPPAQRDAQDESLDFLPRHSPLRAKVEAARAAAAAAAATTTTTPAIASSSLSPLSPAAATPHTTATTAADDEPMYTPRVTPLPAYYDKDDDNSRLIDSSNDRRRRRRRGDARERSTSIFAGQSLLPPHTRTLRADAAVMEANEYHSGDDDHHHHRDSGNDKAATTTTAETAATANEPRNTQHEQQQQQQRRALRDMQLDLRKLAYYKGTPHYAPLLQRLRHKYAVDEHTVTASSNTSYSGSPDTATRVNAPGYEALPLTSTSTAPSEAAAVARVRAQLLRALSPASTAATRRDTQPMTATAATPSPPAASLPSSSALQHLAAAAPLSELATAEVASALVRQRLQQLQQRRRAAVDDSGSSNALTRLRQQLRVPALRYDEGDVVRPRGGMLAALGVSPSALAPRRSADEHVIGHRPRITSVDADRHVLYRVLGVDAMQRRQLRYMWSDFPRSDPVLTMHLLSTYPYGQWLHSVLVAALLWLLYTAQLRWHMLDVYDEYLGLDLRITPMVRKPVLLVVAWLAVSMVLSQPLQLLTIAVIRGYRILLRRPIGPP